MRAGLIALASLALLGGCATSAASKFAEPVMAGADTASGAIDYQAFSALTGDVREYRESRRLTLADFKRLAGERGVLVLDARSASAYARGHIKGAVNLPFTDFTAHRWRKRSAMRTGRS